MSRKEPYSTFWLKPQWHLIDELDKNSPEFISQMHSLMRSVTDFVKIDTGREIPVHFSSGQQSYTDGNKVVLAAVTDPYDIDVMVGLAHHESAHCLYSEPLFNYLKTAGKNLDKQSFLPDTVDKAFGHRMLINLIEDARIDSIMYSRLKGYRKYYDRLYEHYLDSDESQILAQHPEMRKPYLESYFFWISRTICGRNTDMTVLPGLDEVMNKIDVKNVRRFDTQILGITEVVADIEKILVNHLIGGRPNLANGMPTKDEMKSSLGLNNLDAGDTELEMTPEELEKFLETYKSFGNDVNEFPGEGGIKITVKGALTNRAANLLNQLYDGDVSVGATGTDKKMLAVIYNHVNAKTLNDPEFLFSHYHRVSSGYIDAGRRLGNILAQKVKVTQDESLIYFPRQKIGKIDKHRIAAIGTGATDVFSHSRIIKKSPVYIHMTVDGSGSMSGLPFDNSMKLVSAFAVMASKLRNFVFSASLRTFTNYGAPLVAVIYDSRVDTPVKLDTIFKRLSVGGGTPEGLAIEAIYNSLFSVEKSYRKFLINISDGLPGNVGNMSGVEYTRKVISKLRLDDINILSYYVGAEYSKADFITMYGRDASFINPDNVHQIAYSFSKLMLQSEGA